MPVLAERHGLAKRFALRFNMWHYFVIVMTIFTNL
jgi:hypothetical protein